MRKALVFMGCLVSTSVSAKEQFGFLCDLQINGQVQHIHISLDIRQAKYTARIGEGFFKRMQEVDVDYGGTLSVQGLKLTFPTSGLDYWLLLKNDGKAFAAPFSGVHPQPIGSCANDTFKGL